MPIRVTKKVFKNAEDQEIDFLKGNAGNYRNITFRLEVDLFVTLSQTETSLIGIEVTGNTIVLESGNWDNISYGDTVVGNYNGIPIPAGMTAQYVEGSTLILTGGTLSGGGVYHVGKIGPDKAPSGFEFYFNMCKNSTSGSRFSLIDGEVTRYTVDGVDTMAVSDSLAFTQLGNKSGGPTMFPTITRLTDPSSDVYAYEIFMAGIIVPVTSGEAENYEVEECPRAWFEFSALPEYGNPDKKLSVISYPTANVGLRDENFNGGPSVFGFQSISWTNENSDPIESMDYSRPSNFIALVSGTFTASSHYNFGWFYDPLDDTVYKNRPAPYDNNIMLCTLKGGYYVEGVPYSLSGSYNSAGAGVEITDLLFTRVSGQLQITGTITPGGTFSNYVSGRPVGDRNYKMWTDLATPGLDVSASNAVNLTIDDSQMIEAPLLGVEFTDVVTNELFDHAGNEITTNEVTTKDDSLFTSIFLLETGQQYDGIRASISAFNSSTGEIFSLEDLFMPFSENPNVNYIAGQYIPDIDFPRNFGLPPNTITDNVSLKRYELADIGTKYGIRLNYGFLARWEYWLEQPNVNDVFFNPSLPFNGRNKDWQRFNSVVAPGWALKYSFFVRKNGVDDFVDFEFTINPLDQTPEITTTTTVTRQDGSTPLDFPSNEIVELEVKINWDQAFTNPWVLLFMERHEGNRIGWISSFQAHGQQPQNPFRPITGETRLLIAGEDTTQIIATCMVNTALLNAAVVNLSTRVHSGGAMIYEPETILFMVYIGIPDDGTIYHDETEFEITGHDQWLAIDAFVKGCKNDGIWDKILRFWPLIGDGYSQKRVDLKFLEEFEQALPGITYTPAGWYGNQESYMNTGFTNESDFPDRDAITLAFYSRSSPIEFGYDMGSIQVGFTDGALLSASGLTSNSAACTNGIVRQNELITSEMGLFMVTSTSDSEQRLYQFIINPAMHPFAKSPTSTHSGKIYWGDVEFNGYPAGAATMKEYCCGLIAEGLNDTEANQMATRIQDLMVANHKEVTM